MSINKAKSKISMPNTKNFPEDFFQSNHTSPTSSSHASGDKRILIRKQKIFTKNNNAVSSRNNYKIPVMRKPSSSTMNTNDPEWNDVNQQVVTCDTANEISTPPQHQKSYFWENKDKKKQVVVSINTNEIMTSEPKLNNNIFCLNQIEDLPHVPEFNLFQSNEEMSINHRDIPSSAFRTNSLTLENKKIVNMLELKNKICNFNNLNVKNSGRAKSKDRETKDMKRGRLQQGGKMMLMSNISKDAEKIWANKPNLRHMNYSNDIQRKQRFTQVAAQNLDQQITKRRNNTISPNHSLEPNKDIFSAETSGINGYWKKTDETKKIKKHQLSLKSNSK